MKGSTCNTVGNDVVFIFLFVVFGPVLYGLGLIIVRGVKAYTKRGDIFSSDKTLIQFVKQIVPVFSNRYGNHYVKDAETWNIGKEQKEVRESFYESVIARDELIQETKKLFFRYQNDWMYKRFDAMSSYIERQYNIKQHNIFKKLFKDGYDIVYNPEIFSVTPVRAAHHNGGIEFKMQINAQVTNFDITSDGSVKSGEAYPRKFTEFWIIFIDKNKKLILKNIEQYSFISKTLDRGLISFFILLAIIAFFLLI